MDRKIVLVLVLLLCISSSAGAALMMGGEKKSDKTVPNLLKDPVGTPIQCNANDVGSGVNAAVYRYMGGTELRHYPNPPIATSWDSDWGSTFKKIDCAGLTQGAAMAAKPN
tara:strand:- start:2620 stop:2952 length:333 start_codon:yes stop_codon:yes gene_type:complete